MSIDGPCLPGTCESCDRRFRGLRNPISDTEQFYTKYFRDLPPMNKNRLIWRYNFLKEEMKELGDAIVNDAVDGAAEEVVDALIDLMVVALGTLYEAGVDINLAWTVVHEANMTKVRGAQPSKRSGSGGFDLIKPLGWRAPSHDGNTGILKEMGERKGQV